MYLNTAEESLSLEDYVCETFMSSAARIIKELYHRDGIPKTDEVIQKAMRVACLPDASTSVKLTFSLSAKGVEGLLTVEHDNQVLIIGRIEDTRRLLGGAQ